MNAMEFEQECAQIKIQIEELLKQLDLMSKGNQAAGRRFRVISLIVEKLMKKMRRTSIDQLSKHKRGYEDKDDHIPS